MLKGNREAGIVSPALTVLKFKLYTIRMNKNRQIAVRSVKKDFIFITIPIA
jgi:hypothetical protein